MILDELQKLCDAATPGPWGNAAGGVLYKPAYVPAMTDVETGKTAHRKVEWNEDGDAAFTVAARTYLPRLIAVARAGKVLHNAPMVSLDGSEASDAYDALGDALAALEHT